MMLSSDISIHGFFISLPYRDKSLFQITLIIIEKRSSMESLWDFFFLKKIPKKIETGGEDEIKKYYDLLFFQQPF